MIYFANRSMGNVRDMKPNNFGLHLEGDKEYYTLTRRDMHTKNHQDDQSQGGQIHALPGNPSNCFYRKSHYAMQAI